MRVGEATGGGGKERALIADCVGWVPPQRDGRTVTSLRLFHDALPTLSQATSISLLRSRGDIAVSSRDVYEKQAELGRRFLQVVRVLACFVVDAWFVLAAAA